VFLLRCYPAVARRLLCHVQSPVSVTVIYPYCSAGGTYTSPQKTQTPDIYLPIQQINPARGSKPQPWPCPLSPPHFGPAFAFLFPRVFLSHHSALPMRGVNIPDQQYRWHIPGESGADRAGSKSKACYVYAFKRLMTSCSHIYAPHVVMPGGRIPPKSPVHIYIYIYIL